MKLNLNKNDLEKLRNLIDIKYTNIAVSEMLEEFNSYYGLVNAQNIQKSKTTFLDEFLNHFEIDTIDQENLEIINKSLKPAINEAKEDLLENNAYFKNIKFKEIKYNGYALEYDTYHPYQTFPYDDVKFVDNYREIFPTGYLTKEIKYPAISKNNIIWMCITPNEIKTMQKHIDNAKGDVLTFGLGLGYYAYMVSLKKEVQSVTIIESSKEVIELFNKYILPQFQEKEKIHIVQSDAFKYLDKNDMNKFDYVFVDIYHGANDGLPLYLKFKEYEKEKVFSYWLENSLLGLYRRLVLTVIEENLEGYVEQDYQVAKTKEDKIINSVYFKLKNRNFSTYEEIYQLLSEKGLKDLIKEKCED